jgi:hypothetical protein
MLKKINFIFLTLLLYSAATAQNCTTPGQSPSTAFPVCGTKTFKQPKYPYAFRMSLPFRAAAIQEARTKTVILSGINLLVTKQAPWAF